MAKTLTTPLGVIRRIRPPKSLVPPVVLPLVMIGIDVARGVGGDADRSPSPGPGPGSAWSANGACGVTVT